MATASGLRPGEEKLFPGQPKGFPFGDFDVEDVMLPDGEAGDMGIPSDESDSGEGAPAEESGFGSVIGAWARRREEEGRGVAEEEERERRPRRSGRRRRRSAGDPAARTHTHAPLPFPPHPPNPVVDNLPCVPTEKHDKLCTVVRKVFSQIGPILDGEKKKRGGEREGGGCDDGGPRTRRRVCVLVLQPDPR